MLNSAVALLLQALGVVLFFNRFIAGIMLRFLKRKSFDEADYSYQPTVTVVEPKPEPAPVPPRGPVLTLAAFTERFIEEHDTIFVVEQNRDAQLRGLCGIRRIAQRPQCAGQSDAPIDERA